MDFFLELDKDLFFLINGLNSPFMDNFMVLVSGKWIWAPLYLVLIWFAAKKMGWKSLWVIGGVILAVVLADQLTSSFMKPFFERLRPSRDPELEGLVHLVNNYRGGKYGFASSHAANSFAVATFFVLVFGKEHRILRWLLLWAAVVSFSRVYLGVHYPGDVIVGGLIGAGISWGLFWVWRRFFSPLRR